MTTSTVPIIRAAGEGERRSFYGGGVHTWKATATETGGSLILFEDALERGKTTPLHAHPDVDEVVYVIEGEILVRVGDEDRRVARGGTVVTPRGVPHAFMVVSDRARLLFLQTPGNGEAFYRQASDPATSAAEGSVSEDVKRVRDAAQQTGATLMLGPPPFAKQIA